MKNQPTQRMLLKEEDLMQKPAVANQAPAETAPAKHLTLTREHNRMGEAFLFIRLDGEIVKCFVDEDEDAAAYFFNTYKEPTKPVEVLSERFLDDESPVPTPASDEPGKTLIVYRAVTITDKPYGNTPYTMIHKGMTIDHQDEASLPEMFDSIDEMLDGYAQQDEEAFIEPRPAWRSTAQINRKEKRDREWQEHQERVEYERRELERQREEQQRKDEEERQELAARQAEQAERAREQQEAAEALLRQQQQQEEKDRQQRERQERLDKAERDNLEWQERIAKEQEEIKAERRRLERAQLERSDEETTRRAPGSFIPGFFQGEYKSDMERRIAAEEEERRKMNNGQGPRHGQDTAIMDEAEEQELVRLQAEPEKQAAPFYSQAEIDSDKEKLSHRLELITRNLEDMEELNTARSREIWETTVNQVSDILLKAGKAVNNL